MTGVKTKKRDITNKFCAVVKTLMESRVEVVRVVIFPALGTQRLHLLLLCHSLPTPAVDAAATCTLLLHPAATTMAKNPHGAAALAPPPSWHLGLVSPYPPLLTLLGWCSQSILCPPRKPLERPLGSSEEGGLVSWKQLAYDGKENLHLQELSVHEFGGGQKGSI